MRRLHAIMTKVSFSIERNLFLSLHSGLGIDTYPIGIDEQPERVLEIFAVDACVVESVQKSRCQHVLFPTVLRR